jgi:hypothetical protein
VRTSVPESEQPAAPQSTDTVFTQGGQAPTAGQQLVPQNANVAAGLPAVSQAPAANGQTTQPPPQSAASPPPAAPIGVTTESFTVNSSGQIVPTGTTANTGTTPSASNAGTTPSGAGAPRSLDSLLGASAPDEPAPTETASPPATSQATVLAPAAPATPPAAQLPPAPEPATATSIRLVSALEPGIYAQVASYGSAATAQANWPVIWANNPGLRAYAGEAQVWGPAGDGQFKTRFGPFSTVAEATTVCDAVTDPGMGCYAATIAAQ